MQHNSEKRNNLFGLPKPRSWFGHDLPIWRQTSRSASQGTRALPDRWVDRFRSGRRLL